MRRIPQPCRTRRSQEGVIPRIPVLVVGAMQLPIVLGYGWDRVKRWRDTDPAFPKPFRALDATSRPRWLVSQLQAYLEAKHAEQMGRTA